MSGGGQTLNPGQTSAPMTVSISAAPSSDLTVTLSTTSATGNFSSTSVTIKATQTTSGTFTYTDSSVGTWTVTASATGATNTTTPITIAGTAPASMNVAVTAGAATKKGPNYGVPLTVTARDSSGAAISGASVTLGIYPGSTCFGTPVTSGSSTTSSSGQTGFNFSTRQTGAWCAKATVTASGYTSANGSAQFSTP